MKQSPKEIQLYLLSVNKSEDEKLYSDQSLERDKAPSVQRERRALPKEQRASIH